MISFFRSFLAPPRHLILLVAALWIGLLLAERRAGRYNISSDVLNSIIYYSLFASILGGRLLYALEHFSAFAQSPLSFFSPNPDLFDPIGALVVALLVGFIYGQRQRLSLWRVLDALTPLFATILIGLSLAHLASGRAFGSPTDLPWGIELWGATRHPSQIYEFIASISILGLIWFRKADSPPGISFLTFAALTAGAHLFLEAFRGDSILIFGGLRLTQILAWLVLAVSLFVRESLMREEAES